MYLPKDFYENLTQEVTEFEKKGFLIGVILGLSLQHIIYLFNVDYQYFFYRVNNQIDYFRFAKPYSMTLFTIAYTIPLGGFTGYYIAKQLSKFKRLTAKK